MLAETTELPEQFQPEQIYKSFNTVSVAMFGEENKRVVSISNLLNINLSDIETECKEQSKEYVWWAQVAAKATQELSALQLRRDKAIADLKREEAKLSLLAKTPQGIVMTHGAIKVTVDTVHDWVVAHPQYMEAQERVHTIEVRINEMSFAVQTYINMRDGFKMKAKMLQAILKIKDKED